MLVLRPVEPTDLPQLQQLARDSLVGVTSLPDDAERLREKIAGSCASFDSPAEAQARRTIFSSSKTSTPDVWSAARKSLPPPGSTNRSTACATVTSPVPRGN